jgi:hypothetical protein
MMLNYAETMHSAVSERRLPACVRDALADARASRPGAQLTCISFHTRENGREIARLGPPEALFDACTNPAASTRLRPKDVLVLTVTTTETTFASVRTLTHVLIVVVEQRSPLRIV